MTRVRRRRDPRGLLGTQMDSGPRLAVLPLPRGVCRSGVTAHPELGGDTALRTPFKGHAGRAGPGAPGGSASSAMSGAVSHQAAERTWATRPSVSNPPPPAGLPPWWQDPPRSTALVPGAAAPAGPESQPRRLLWCGGPRAGTGGSGLRAARVGGRRGPGAHIPGCVQCIHEVLVTAGIAERQLLGAFQALPVLQGAQGKGRRALVCGGAHTGGLLPAAGPGLFVETGLVMKHNLPRPQISDRCFKQNRGQRTRASCRQPEGRTGCPRAVWHPHVTATGATSRCWVCGRQRARLPTCPHTPQLPGGQG